MTLHYRNPQVKLCALILPTLHLGHAFDFVPPQLYYYMSSAQVKKATTKNVIKAISTLLVVIKGKYPSVTLFPPPRNPRLVAPRRARAPSTILLSASSPCPPLPPPP
jgi:hypothetical protein